MYKGGYGRYLSDMASNFIKRSLTIGFQEFEAREQKIQRKSEQLKEAEELREEFARLRDDFALQKIAIDNKDRKIQELKAQVYSNTA
jgi:hypothetical protein